MDALGKGNRHSHERKRIMKLIHQGLIATVSLWITGTAVAADITVTMNPTDSCLTSKLDGITRIRFEDYVSNPQPEDREAQQGWIARFPIPFNGLIAPASTNTTLRPLPKPVGMLIESSADTVGFYDPSSRVDCADPRADRLVFRFVDPADPERAATVSRVAFRLIGTSLAKGNVRFSLHDIAGKTLGSGVAKPSAKPGSYQSEIDCVARTSGREISAIHKLEVEHSPGGYFVVGNVLRPALPDFGFGGFKTTGRPVKRSLDELIPHAHSAQWNRQAEADLITDLTRCTPASALSNRRHLNTWKIFEYDTAEFSGKCISIGRESSAPDLSLKLGKKGWHAVYIGLSTITDLVRPDRNRVEAKFTKDPAYTRLGNRLELGTRRRGMLEEVFLGVADLTGNDLHFSTVYQQPARIHFVKTIPLTESEVDAVLADRKQSDTRNLVATFDGYTWIHPFRPQNRADLAATFSAYRHSDFKTWWFQVGGADLVHHPTKVGNLMGGHLDTFPRSVDREYVESVRHLHSRGINPMQVAVEEAHAQDAEILICLRAAGWKGAPPWEEFFMSAFYEAHPEWRCIDHDGTPTMHLSYAVKEVQDHLLEVYREALQTGADGAGFLFHRGMPMILWEEPFCRRFIAKHGLDPRKLAEDDPRVYAMRGEIITGFIRKIRRVLDEVRSERGDRSPRLKLAVSTFATRADNEKFGLDVELWIKERLIDQIGIAWFAYHTSGVRTKSGDTAYYARITKGSPVNIYPFYVGWKMESGVRLLKDSVRHYAQGADGFAVWDPNQFENWQTGKAPYWPLISRLGHRKQVRDGSLLFAPVRIPLTRLGENHYSRWYPNTGF
jgi:hypothetical protein